MERTFKKGDLVECIDNSGLFSARLTNGKIYEVLRVKNGYMHIKCDDDDDEIIGFNPFRFKLHKAAEELSGTTEQVDMVNNPPHYNQGSVECIEAIKAALTEEEFRGYCKANAIKYIWREKHKGGNESIEKAIWYLKQLL